MLLIGKCFSTWLKDLTTSITTVLKIINLKKWPVFPLSVALFYYLNDFDLCSVSLG